MLGADGWGGEQTVKPYYLAWFSSHVLVSSPKTLTLSRWTDDEDWFSLSQETPN